jgi:hypothetical protein
VKSRKLPKTKPSANKTYSPEVETLWNDCSFHNTKLLSSKNSSAEKVVNHENDGNKNKEIDKVKNIMKLKFAPE